MSKDSIVMDFDRKNSTHTHRSSCSQETTFSIGQRSINSGITPPVSPNCNEFKTSDVPFIDLNEVTKISEQFERRLSEKNCAKAAKKISEFPTSSQLDETPLASYQFRSSQAKIVPPTVRLPQSSEDLLRKYSLQNTRNNGNILKKIVN